MSYAIINGQKQDKEWIVIRDENQLTVTMSDTRNNKISKNIRIDWQDTKNSIIPTDESQSNESKLPQANEKGSSTMTLIGATFVMLAVGFFALKKIKRSQ